MKQALSSRKRRIAAYLIDHLIISLLMVFIAFLALGPDFMDKNNPDSMNAIMLAVLLPGFFLYFGKESIQGISPGKWVMGIMVRDMENRENIPSFGRLLLRNLFMVIWPIEFLVLATNERKQRLGDQVAKTIVVQNPNKPARLPRILVLAITGIFFFAFTILFTGLAMKSSDAYKVAIKEIEKNKNIRTETGGIKGYGMMPTGNISITNGHGNAQLEIKVLGVEKDVKYFVSLEKEEEGQWKLIEIE